MMRPQNWGFNFRGCHGMVRPSITETRFFQKTGFLVSRFSGFSLVKQEVLERSVVRCIRRGDKRSIGVCGAYLLADRLQFR
jgi:hypothetical protein